MWSILCFAMKFDFVEIGTSNFDTLTQQKAGIGLSVEALNVYLRDLPDNPSVIKVNHAVIDDFLVSSQPSVPFFFVDPNNIKKYKLPWWIKGCNTAYSPHIEAMQA